MTVWESQREGFNHIGRSKRDRQKWEDLNMTEMPEL